MAGTSWKSRSKETEEKDKKQEEEVRECTCNNKLPALLVEAPHDDLRRILIACGAVLALLSLILLADRHLKIKKGLAISW